MPDNRLTPTNPPLPTKAGDRRHWYGLAGASRALAIASAARGVDRPSVVVTASSHDAQQLEAALAFFADGTLPVQVMPDWETLPYDVFSPHQDIVSRRLRTLHELSAMGRGILIVPVSTLMQRIAPPDFLAGRVISLTEGQTLDLDAMRERLERAGYRRVAEVMEHGEFAVRGAIMDLYAMGSERPVRIDLFDDEIDSLRLFDPETQRSEDRIERLELLPAREFPTGEEGIRRFRQGFRAEFEGDPNASVVYREVSEGRMPNGIEYYLPLFFEETATLFDYLPAGVVAFRVGDVDDQLDDDWAQINHRYEQRRHDRERPLLAPARLYLSPDDTRQVLNRMPQVVVFPEEIEPPGSGRDARFEVTPLPELRSSHEAAAPLSRLQSWLSGFDGRVLFSAETAGRREAMLERLRTADVRPRTVAGWGTFLKQDADVAITVAPLEDGAIRDRKSVV